MSSVSRCDAGSGYAFACFGGSAAGLGNIFECNGSSEVLLSNTFVAHGGSVAAPRAALEHTGGPEGGLSNLFRAFWGHSGRPGGTEVARKAPKAVLCDSTVFLGGKTSLAPEAPEDSRLNLSIDIYNLIFFLLDGLFFLLGCLFFPIGWPIFP